MKQRDVGDILGGGLMIGIGAFALIYGQRYHFGTVDQMGPGFFPVVLGGLLVVLGVTIMLPAFDRPGPTLEFKWRTLAFVVGGIILFAATLRPLGLVLTTIVAVLAVASADRGFSWAGRLLLAGAIALLAWIIFRAGLRMNIPVWPRWL